MMPRETHTALQAWPARAQAPSRRAFVRLAGLLVAGAGCAATIAAHLLGAAQAYAQDDGASGQDAARPDWSSLDGLDGLAHTESVGLRWAQNFTLDRFEGGFSLACIKDGTRYLLVPEADQAPEGLPGDVVALDAPAHNLYLASSATLCLFAALDAVGAVSFVSVSADDCTVPAFKQAIEDGCVAYGGKYSAPDYEAFLGGGCKLAIENTMINHTPEVREKLIELGVPVIVEQSSLEAEPLGRLEWILLWGELCGAAQTAQDVLDEQAKLVDEVVASIAADPVERTVAFFHLNANGSAVVRKPGDYVAKMIAMAGGTYVFSNLAGDEESNSSSVTMEMEAFYTQAKDADVIVYNSTIAGELSGLADLVALNPLLAQFKAVQNGEAWCYEQNVYQQMTSTGQIVSELHEIISGTQEDRLEFLFRLV